MGADLYLWSEFKPHHATWSKKFEEACAERDALKEGTPEYQKAHEKVMANYEAMYERGYFRDSYNDSNLLWHFGLSWWADVIPLLGDSRYLTPEKAAEFLAMLDRQLPEFMQKLAGAGPEETAYFLEKHRDLVAFLTHSIELKEPIECSL